MSQCHHFNTKVTTLKTPYIVKKFIALGILLEKTLFFRHFLKKSQPKKHQNYFNFRIYIARPVFHEKPKGGSSDNFFSVLFSHFPTKNMHPNPNHLSNSQFLGG